MFFLLANGFSSFSTSFYAFFKYFYYTVYSIFCYAFCIVYVSYVCSPSIRSFSRGVLQSGTHDDKALESWSHMNHFYHTFTMYYGAFFNVLSLEYCRWVPTLSLCSWPCTQLKSVCSHFRTNHCQFLMKSVWESRTWITHLAVLTVEVYEHAWFFLMVNM